MPLINKLSVYHSGEPNVFFYVQIKQLTSIIIMQHSMNRHMKLNMDICV